MTKQEGMKKSNAYRPGIFTFVINSLFVIRASSF